MTFAGARRVAGRRFTGVSARRAPARKMVWARAAVEGTATGGATLNANLLGNFESVYGANLIGATIIRVRGVVMVTGSSLDTRHTLGCVIGKQDDVWTGNGPETDRYLDWFVYEPFATSTDAGSTGSSFDRRVIDSRSARKMEELDQQAWLVLQSDQTASETAIWSGLLSVLLKLP